MKTIVSKVNRKSLFPHWENWGGGILFLLTILFAACQADDNWEPGPEVPEGIPQVYFSSDNPFIVGHMGANEASFKLSVERTDTVGELTVPIVVTDSIGHLIVPESVTFADGEDVVDMEIAYSYQPGMLLSLSLGAGFGNPYLEQDGTLNYKCRIAKLNKLCKVKYRDDSGFAQTESYIYSYEGMNRFCFSNFLDSGIDVTFTVDTKHTDATFDPDNVRTLKGDFVPLDNMYADEGGWYLYNDKADDYTSWTPTGWDKTIHYLFYNAYDEEQQYSYSYIDFSNKSYSRFWAPLAYYDEDFAETEYLSIYYSLIFNISTEDE